LFLVRLLTIVNIPPRQATLKRVGRLAAIAVRSKSGERIADKIASESLLPNRQKCFQGSRPWGPIRLGQTRKREGFCRSLPISIDEKKPFSRKNKGFFAVGKAPHRRHEKC
jgi:hypothetical protein